MSEKPKPVHTVRLGSIQAAIWSNPGQHGPIYNVTLERSFRDGEGQWQTSQSFGRNDLLVVAKVADAAHSFICERQASARANGKSEDNEAASDDEQRTAAAHAERGRARSR